MQEAVAKCIERIKIVSDKVGELRKFTNGTIKMVPATIVSVKATVERLAVLLDLVNDQTKESKTAIVEATTLLHDCKQMLIDNRQVMFTEMQKQLSEVNAKCDRVVEKLRLLETWVPERPPYQVPPEQQRPASSSQAAPDLFDCGAPDACAAGNSRTAVNHPDPGDAHPAGYEHDGPKGTPLREALGHIPELGKFSCKSFDA